jgi:tRNA pseudouridine13 synthase
MYNIKQKPEDFIVNEITNIGLKDKGPYSVFLLKKKDYTTEKAVQTIANKLNIPRKNIGYAGNKDKVAITTQYISIKNTNIKELDLKDINLGFKGYLDRPISLGDLEGNEFEINVITKKEPKKISKIINYFGEQRFSKNNIEIGKNIVKKDFKKAVEFIDDKNVKDYINEKPADFIGAIKQVPLKILKLYVHAYQSYLWNKLAEMNNNQKNNFKLSIIGFGTEIEPLDYEIKEQILDILSKEEISERDFIIRQIPEISSEGAERELFTEVQDLKIKKQEKGYKLKFKLKKGCYATEVIKQMFE